MFTADVCLKSKTRTTVSVDYASLVWGHIGCLQPLLFTKHLKLAQSVKEESVYSFSCGSGRPSLDCWHTKTNKTLQPFSLFVKIIMVSGCGEGHKELPERQSLCSLGHKELPESESCEHNRTDHSVDRLHSTFCPDHHNQGILGQKHGTEVDYTAGHPR